MNKTTIVACKGEPTTLEWQKSSLSSTLSLGQAFCNQRRSLRLEQNGGYHLYKEESNKV
jgi:hypothetical protein